MSAEPILEVDSLTKQFGGIVAVDQLSFSVAGGSTTGLIGPNGAGKTTTFNLINGILTPDNGTISYDGTDVTGKSPVEVAHHGIGRTFQDVELFPELTVEENLVIATNDENPDEQAAELLSLIELENKAGDIAENLSYGQSKLVGLARAFMLDPDLILLDEPLSGINPSLQNEILKMTNSLQERFGTTYFIIEHDMGVVMNECDTIIVMDSGAKLAEGPPDEIQTNEEVLEAYFGREEL